MLKIEMHGMHFHAYHGLYPEEKMNGAPFLVDADIEYQPDRMPATLENIVDYSKVFALIQSEMNKAEPLLENLVVRIANRILAQYLTVDTVHIRIQKLRPPIKDYEGTVGLSFTAKRK